MTLRIEKLSPYIRVAIDSVLDETWTVEERVIWDYELLYLMEGQLLVTVEDHVYHGTAGDFFFFKPGQRHSIRNVGGTRVRQPHVHFDLYTDTISSEIGVSFKKPEAMTAKERSWMRVNELNSPPYYIPSYFRPRDALPITQSLFELIREFETKPPFYELRMKGALLNILAQMMREQYWGSMTSSDGHMELLAEVRSYIDQNAHRMVKLDELSERFHLSKFYLINLFKTMFQMTPIQYHQHIRIEKAKNMIQYTHLSMQDIADQLGYANIHAFSRAFKSSAGSCPSDYRRGR
ncbi:helix-turn-helix domain-containing protein [Paenibacillus albus]|uniref:AraC family transcriptional regulator n=1 Tax=Paenibacillus albus TaxID=2495582 RepID=A0A3S9A5T9_9BACL|nr:AraC family transcriptional regulator [Paenibacillus albus]AZN41073.1 AraC family transcriptional regulator [Paenibacillus albus]